MIKFVDRLDLKSKIILGYSLLPTGVYKLVDEELKEDPDGIRIDTRELASLIYTNLEENLNPELTDYFNGELTVVVRPDLPPDVIENPDEPDTPDKPPKPDETSGKKVIRVMNTGKKMSWYSEPYDKFVFNRKGPEYTKHPFEIVFSDGNRLVIPDPKKMNMTPDNMKYQPGGEYSGNNPDIPTMECYARKGTHPEWCEARFQHTVEEADAPPSQPDTPEEDKYNFRVVFGGNKGLGWSGHDSRDRLWWTKIHGGSHPIWSQKFPLPRWIDDRSYRLYITYSDGSKFTVPDTRREFYMTSASGPKYRHQDPSERDPKKMHPKVSSKEKTMVDWIDVKVVPN